MAIGDDLLINYGNRRIVQDHAYVAGTDTPYSTQALYTYLMSVFDDLEQMDNTIPMSAQTPNAFTMINGWFIDDETVKWLNDGAIVSSGWLHPTNPTGVRLLALDAIAGVDDSDLDAVVLGGTTGDTGKLLAYNTTRKLLWVRCDGADDLFDDNAEAITVGGVACGNMTAVSTSGENLYVNLYTLGSLTSASDTIYIIQAGTKISAWWGTGIDACDVLIKVKEMGTTIDSGNVIVFCRYYPTAGDAALYDHFPITLTAGRQAVPLSTALDLNNTNSQATVSGYISTYTVTFGFAGPYNRELQPGVFKDYDVEIKATTGGGIPLAALYEVCKYVTREGSTEQLDGADGEQYITADPSYALVKQSPFGSFAGGKFFGARGIWIEGYVATDAQNFQLIASDGTTQNPPNTVICRVTSLVDGDSVSMFMLEASEGAIEKDTWALDGAHPAASTTVLVTTDISPNWAGQAPPKADGGYLRVVKTDGSEVLKGYTTWSSKTFTLDGTLGVDCESGDKVYVPIIDAVASGSSIQNTLIQDATIYVITRVRKYGGPAPNSIIPFEIYGSVGAVGLSVPAIRTEDGIVT